MIVDAILYTLAGFFIIAGYRAGFLKSLFSLVGYIAGGIFGFYIALNHLTGLEHLWNTVLGSILVIIIFALVGRFLGRRLADVLRATIVRGPLRWIDSILGSALELIRLALISYIVLSLLMFSPWSTLRDAVGSSNVFARMEKALPLVITDLRDQFKSREIDRLRQYEPNELKKLQLN